jgi:hypothetical protein
MHSTGDRPLPSCLGGGDLDGDIYNVIPLNNSRLAGFKPTRSHSAAKYPPAVKKLLDRRSTMRDVAEFVMDYIVSDVSQSQPFLATNFPDFTLLS